jgi:hypothetical protein
VVVQIGGEIDQRLEPVGATDASQHDRARLGELASTEWSVVRLVDSVEPVQDGGQATARDAADGDDARSREVEPVGLSFPVGVDASGDSPPAAASLSPTQGSAGQPARGCFLDREQATHRLAPAFDALGWS